ncbi:MAG TPA: CDP-alcohol phosphatidyltransferase family protein [bacterium]|jgi:hypothetical protein|nr:CDP-alcohol phosphatidyltransferase family protein [Spirochaetota bacterium]HPM46817.1 CDP-alcohol phosphatidyltransferase family protein [bacterium]
MEIKKTKFSIVIYAKTNSKHDVDQKLLGLSLLKRQILTAENLDPENVVVVKNENDTIPSGRILFINAAYFVHPLALTEIAAGDSFFIEEGGYLAFLDSKTAANEIKDFLKNGIFKSENTTPPSPGYRVLVDSPEKLKVLSKELFNAMRKPVDGLVARTLNKAVSFFLTEYVWLPLRFTPNMVTFITVCIGVLSGIFCAGGTYTYLVIGTFLSHFASILDGCDGEVARLTFKTTTIGKWFDSVGDSIVNTSLMIGLGYGLEPYFGTLPIIIGWSTTAVSWIHNFVSYYDVIVVRKTTDIFAFTWWFEKKDRVRKIDLSKPVYGTISFLDLLKYFSRRDFYLFIYFVLAVVGPTAIMFGYIATAIFLVPSFFLTIAHIYFGIIKKI